MQNGKQERVKAGYHHGGGALPFCFVFPYIALFGLIAAYVRTWSVRTYAGKEKGQGLIYNSSLLLCNMIYSSQHNNCERAQFQMDINRILSERAI